MTPEELKEKLCGVLVVMTTPFKANFELDREGVRKHTRFLIDSGVKEGVGVLVPTGSTGECPMLKEDERKEVIKIVVEEANGEVPVVAGCNHTDTRAVIELCQYAQQIGADGVMISPPYYWKPTEEVILHHYQTIAKEVDLGIMVYNNWFTTQVDIPIETMKKLADIPTIVGLKENSPSIGKFDRICFVLGGKISIVDGNGDGHEPYPALMGSRGIVSGFSNLAPEKMLEIYRAEKEGNYVQARDLYHKLVPIIDLIYPPTDLSRYIVYLKESMNLVGIPAGPARPPLPPLSAREKTQLRKVLEELGLAQKKL